MEKKQEQELTAPKQEAALPTWQQLLDEGAKMLGDAGISEAGLDAWYLLEASFPTDWVHFLMDRNRTVREELLAKCGPRYRAYLEDRAARIPLQQILGSQEFMGLPFRVDENVLIPRQDTETLVEAVLREHPERDCSVLDMCTGSGCIALSLAVLGKYRTVTAADLSPLALRMAKKNASALFLVQKGVVKSQSSKVSETPWRFEMTAWIAGTAQECRTAEDGQIAGQGRTEAETRRLVLAESDLFAGLDPLEKYDIVVSNPPYIPSAQIDGLEPEVRDHEPRMALDGSEDGLYFYRRLAAECGNWLKGGGSVYLEIGFDQAAEVSRLLADAGYRDIRVLQDAPGLDRVVAAVWP